MVVISICVDSSATANVKQKCGQVREEYNLLSGDRSHQTLSKWFALAHYLLSFSKACDQPNRQSVKMEQESS
ncbi:hypothetical protein [Chlorogloeopsis sp. ULAP02]|uniref:hypothetical protein n=1 Tax=Chlorogloeopsis sp. ULAP02 TaxID=3107926 RepID=UPI0031353325